MTKPESVADESVRGKRAARFVAGRVRDRSVKHGPKGGTRGHRRGSRVGCSMIDRWQHTSDRTPPASR